MHGRLVARVSLLLVAASATCLGSSAPTARAATDGVHAFVISDSDGDGWEGLSYRASPSAGATVVYESAYTRLSELSGSSDGSRISYLQTTFTPRNVRTGAHVMVRDSSRRVVAELDTLPTSDRLSFTSVVLSPDGNRAAWGLRDALAITSTTRTSVVGSGDITVARAGVRPLAFLDGETLLVQNDRSRLFTMPFTGGVLTAVSTLPDSAYDVAVSPDGTRIAFRGYSSQSNPWTSPIDVAAIALNNAVLTAGPTVELASGHGDLNPSFSRDSSTVYWARTDGTGSGPGDLWSRPFDASTPAAELNSTPEKEWDVFFVETDVTPPAAPSLTSPFLLDGSHATIRWALPADADVSGVIVSRPAGAAVYLPAPMTQLSDSGLAIGSVYPYTVTAVDRSGNLSSVATRSLRAITPGPWVADPTSTYSTRTSFPVLLAAGGSPGTTYYADWAAATGGYTTWVGGDSAASRLFGGAGSIAVAATPTPAPGAEYRFRSRVVDEYGNISDVAPGIRLAVVPFDQTKAAFVGGTTVASSKAYLGTFRRLASPSSYARVTLVGNRLQVVGWKCQSCGSFTVYDGSTKIGTVSSYSGTLIPRVVLFTKTYAGNATHTFTIRPLGTAGHPGVVLDGFAMRR